MLGRPVIGPRDPEPRFNDSPLIIDYNANEPVHGEVKLSGMLRYALVELSCEINVTGAGNLNALQPECLVQNIKVGFDGRDAEAEKFGPLEHFRLRNERLGIELDRTVISAGTGTKVVKCYYMLCWSRPWSAIPRETVANFFTQHKEFHVTVNWAGIDVAIDAGTKAFTVNPQLRFFFDLSLEDEYPTYRYKESYEELANLGTSAQSQYQLPLKHGAFAYDHLLFATMEDDTGANGGRQYSEGYALNSSYIEMDRGSNVIHKYLEGVDLNRMRQYMKWQAGNVATVPTGVFHLNASREGLISKSLQASGLENLKLRGSLEAPLVDGVTQMIYGTVEEL